MRRTHCVSVRLHAAELARLDAMRGTMPRGTCLRRTWDGARLPRPIPPANLDCLRELRGISANLNQIARHANGGGGLDLDDLGRQVADLRRTLLGLAV